MPIGILNEAEQLYNSPAPQYFPGSTVPGLNSMQQQGIQSNINAGQQMAGYVPGMMGQAQGMMDQYGQWMQGGGPQIGQEYMNMMSPGEINAIQGNFEVNPFIEGQADAFGQAAQRQLEQNILPSTTSNALMAGQMGSSRHGIAQGLATANLGQSLQEATANLYGNAWQNAAQNQLTSRGQTLSALGQDRQRGTSAALGNAQNQLSAYGLMPSMMNAYGGMANTAAGLSMLPGSAMMAGGNMNRNVAQQQLQEEQARWNYEQMSPWDQLARYQGYVTGAPANQASYNAVGSPMNAALGGAGSALSAWDAYGQSMAPT